MSYKIYREFPVLYGIEKNGKTKIWKASIYKDNEGKAMCSIEFGQIDGKKQVSTREYKEGKNIGKKNETSPLQQCINETNKKWEDKKDKENYRENKENISNLDNDEKNDNEKYFPMLAHTYENNENNSKNKKNDISFPCYVQPKLDGLRCIMYKNRSGTIKCQSRTGTYFDTMEHITNELYNLFYNPIVLDGELYTDNMPFEELSGLIKKKKISDIDKEKLKNVKYHVYDIIDSNKTYEDRYNDIINLIGKNKYKYTLTVPTYLTNKYKFKDFFSHFIELGYEGIILRNIKGFYRCNYRSYDLQKYKEFLESEYEIVNFKEGEGRDRGCIIWVCKTDDGKEFNVRPKGTLERRKEFFNNGSQYIGKNLTVIYQELSEIGIPRFPVGKDIRDVY
jgi:DNA ligase-1